MKSGLGGDVYALSEAAAHILSMKFFGPFEGMNPGVVGLEGCENLYTHLETKKMVAEKFLVRHSL